MFKFNSIEDYVYFQAAILHGSSLKELQKYLRVHHKVRMPMAFVLQLVLNIQVEPFSANTTKLPQLKKDLDEKVALLLESL